MATGPGLHEVRRSCSITLRAERLELLWSGVNPLGSMMSSIVKPPRGPRPNPSGASDLVLDAYEAVLAEVRPPGTHGRAQTQATAELVRRAATSLATPAQLARVYERLQPLVFANPAVHGSSGDRSSVRTHRR